MAFLGSLDITGSALTAERYRTDIILQNIANADTIGVNGEDPYRRQLTVFQERPLTFESALTEAQQAQLKQGGVRVSDVIEDEREFKMVYDPTNPNANADGYVTYSNVDTTEERVDLIAAANAYTANITALSVAKAMAMSALKIGSNG